MTDWHIANGVSGLFAVCQSSEMFFLTLEERIKIAQKTVEFAAGRVPVIASGHISDDFKQQAEELNAMAKTGVDAVILITNRLAAQEESDDTWIENCAGLLDKIDSSVPLGFYECPYPYKRILSPKMIRWAAQTGRFYFLTISSLIERQYYPVNAKYHLRANEGLPITTVSRTKDEKGLTETFMKEIDMLDHLAKEKINQFIL